MLIAELALDNFRNHGRTRLTPGAGLNILTGPNGAGKTNILEALSLLAPGRGLRGAAFADMARDGAGGGFAVHARCAVPDGAAAHITIGTAVDATQPGRRRVRINGADAAAASMAEWLSVVWLTPAMDRLFVDAASGRRRFLDRMVLALEPRHGHHASRYDAALRARSRLLSQEGRPDPLWLDALDVQLADHGVAMDEARHRLVDALRHEIATHDDGPFARADIRMVGPDGAASAPWTQASLREALTGSRALDAAAGRALAGPHRTDLSVTHIAHGQPAARCSTGEQKALLLSMVLAHGDLVGQRRRHRPILLLDELAAHLDPIRRAALFERLHTGGGQVWMTGTEMGLFAAADGAHPRWTVVDGRVASASP